MLIYNIINYKCSNPMACEISIQEVTRSPKKHKGTGFSHLNILSNTFPIPSPTSPPRKWTIIQKYAYSPEI